MMHKTLFYYCILWFCCYPIHNSLAENPAPVSNGSLALQVEPYQSVYKGKYNGFSVTTRQQLISQPGSHFWLLSNVVESFLGSIEETSLFNIENNQFLVSRYTYERSVLGKKRSQSISFDHQNGIALSEGEETTRIPLTENYFDTLSYQLALREALSKGETDFQFKVIDKNKIKVYEFSCTGKEQLEINNKTYDTLRVIRVRENDKRKTTLWFSPSMDYLMVKLQQNEDGREYSLELESYSRQ